MPEVDHISYLMKNFSPPSVKQFSWDRSYETNPQNVKNFDNFHKHIRLKIVMGPQTTAVRNDGQSAELETVMDIFREMFSGHYHRAGDEGRHVYITARVLKCKYVIRILTG